ncbi:transglycosylase SLT domain-containing protein, partial [Escherichia coli]|uniref:transglycosylase SLT domain-containing protein n=1 Tax=Escherichia coli TaxID=562 RepID=UPI003BA2354F
NTSAFQAEITSAAREFGVEEAVVRAIIHAESAYNPTALSRAGAQGLMQLMPATAKWVAGKIGMSNFTPDSVNDFDTNTELGTNYLNMVLRDLNGS